MIRNLDYYLAALAGFFFGIFAIPTVINIGIRNRPLLIALPLAGVVLFLLGIWLAGLLARWISVLAQLGKFAAVGFLNTAIEFGILNLLSLATGITAGLVVGGINVPGFAVAVVNSFFWNKFWVFRGGGKHTWQDFPKFFAVTLIGLFINSGMIILITSNGGVTSLTGGILLNTAKVFATVVSLSWNFLGYKFLVFRNTRTIGVRPL